MFTLSERIYLLEEVIDDLMLTNSLIEKRNIIEAINPELKDDFECIVECLSGVHKFGYTFAPIDFPGDERSEDNSIRDVINFLLEPAKQGDLSHANVIRHICQVYRWDYFFGPIINRTLKIGIGKSILPKDGLSAMLAKKYEGKVAWSKNGYYITEKLDGNRCIARYDGTRWVFTSRNGKEMHVNFDMGNLPKEYIYDGEIMSPEQVAMSDDIYNCISKSIRAGKSYEDMFSLTSGLINRHSTDKKLIYNIFDIMVDMVPYAERREVLETLEFGGDTRLVKILGHCPDMRELEAVSSYMLAAVTDIGGEGIMINLGDRAYQHKRTDGLLKMKKVQTMDMLVINTEYGTGKYEGQVGALLCQITTDDGKVISCNVGTGLSDEQRLDWAIHPENIIGKIVEIGYFSLSQSNDARGSKFYSLRFPRLKGVRNDKSETSAY